MKIFYLNHNLDVVVTNKHAVHLSFY